MCESGIEAGQQLCSANGRWIASTPDAAMAAERHCFAGTIRVAHCCSFGERKALMLGGSLFDDRSGSTAPHLVL